MAPNGSSKKAAGATTDAPKPAAAQGDSMFTCIVRYAILIGVCIAAVMVRLHAVNIYGRVIHEFDPWFNFRATQYLVDHGHDAFQGWFDTQVWYPLGRPTGSTLYPGMMYTSAFIFRASEALGLGWTLNDVCVFLPAGFAVFAVLCTYALAREVADDAWAGLAAATLMALLPAHLMRSVAGGYDNECIAIAAIGATFFLWVRSLRGARSWPIGFACALSYGYMVAAWGAYTFVLNMIGVHAALLVLLGKFTPKLHHAYSAFYVVGTALALQVPIVGQAPLRSLEQLAPMGVFFGLQLLYACELVRARRGLDARAFRKLRVYVFAGAAAVGAVVVQVLFLQGYLGPLSSRVRGLFLQHQKTGNPLVDSVAEHQATPPSMYQKYFHCAHFLGPIGLGVTWLAKGAKVRDEARYFVLAYYAVTYYFSAKMVRLVLLLAPAASILAGSAIAAVLRWALGVVKGGAPGAGGADAKQGGGDGGDSDDGAAANSARGGGGRKGRKAGKLGKKKRSSAGGASSSSGGSSGGGQPESPWEAVRGALADEARKNPGVVKALAYGALVVAFLLSQDFVRHCRYMAYAMSEPQIMLRGRSKDGGYLMVDDFRESYWWLRDNTPEDARVMAWWDYGYQINGLANRTTIADGNTWNHEHLALLGKALVSPEEQSYHQIIRHMADYVLVWSTRFAGMYGDDLAKMPHIARIAGSVYSDVVGAEYYLDKAGKPSPTMAASLMYKLHSYRLNPEVPEPKYFEEVYTSKNNMVRIYKTKNVNLKAKRYCAEHRGYPPVMQKRVLFQKQDFKQLEDFNQ